MRKCWPPWLAQESKCRSGACTAIEQIVGALLAARTNEMTMKTTNLLMLLVLLWAISACGGSELKSCDEVRRYQLAEAGKRIETPDDLDDLEQLREMPLPKASPRPERPEGSPCLDLPPSVLAGQE